jgi:hypothetical protein
VLVNVTDEMRETMIEDISDDSFFSVNNLSLLLPVELK